MPSQVKTLAQTLTTLGLLLISSTSYAQPQTQDILECMNANVPQSVQFQHLALAHVNRLKETTSYELQLHAQHGKGVFEASVIVKQPASLAGGAYLLTSTSENYQLYMYAPSLGKVRRVTGDGVTRASLLGTDVGWEDLQIMYNAFLEGTMSLRGESEVQGRPVHQLLLIPSPKTPSVYSRIYLDIDKESCVPLEIRLMESGDVLRKRFTGFANSLVKVNNKYWYASKNRMEDIAEGTHTDITVLTQAEVDEKLRNRLFNPKSFHQSR